MSWWNNMLNKSAMAIIAMAVVLTGCSTQHTCKLGTECYGLDDAYKAAVENAGNHETVFPEYNSKGKGSPSKKIESESSLGVQSFKAFQGLRLTDKPVYQPPKPVRIWIAPWQASLESYTQTDPVLMGGQFMYATIPGHWTMGELRKNGGLGKTLQLEPYNLKEEQDHTSNNRVQPKQRLVELPKEK